MSEAWPSLSPNLSAVLNDYTTNFYPVLWDPHMGGFSQDLNQIHAQNGYETCDVQSII